MERNKVITLKAMTCHSSVLPQVTDSGCFPSAIVHTEGKIRSDFNNEGVQMWHATAVRLRKIRNRGTLHSEVACILMAQVISWRTVHIHKWYLWYTSAFLLLRRICNTSAVDAGLPSLMYHPVMRNRSWYFLTHFLLHLVRGWFEVEDCCHPVRPR